jgi:hypothetical protein
MFEFFVGSLNGMLFQLLCVNRLYFFLHIITIFGGIFPSIVLAYTK